MMSCEGNAHTHTTYTHNTRTHTAAVTATGMDSDGVMVLGSIFTADPLRIYIVLRPGTRRNAM